MDITFKIDSLIYFKGSISTIGSIQSSTLFRLGAGSAPWSKTQKKMEKKKSKYEYVVDEVCSLLLTKHINIACG